MGNLETYTSHLYISQALFFVIDVLVVVACIIIISKKRSSGTIILLIGAILKILGVFSQVLLNATVVSKGNMAIMNMQVVLSYVNSFTYFIFGLGFLLFALNDVNKG